MQRYQLELSMGILEPSDSGNYVLYEDFLIEIEKARNEGYAKGIEAARPRWRPKNQNPEIKGQYLVVVPTKYYGNLYNVVHNETYLWRSGKFTHWIAIPGIDS